MNQSDTDHNDATYAAADFLDSELDRVTITQRMENGAADYAVAVEHASTEISKKLNRDDTLITVLLGVLGELGAIRRSIERIDESLRESQ